MDRYNRKKFLNYLRCSLLVFTGTVGTTASGSIKIGNKVFPLNAFHKMSHRKVPKDPMGDDWFLRAVRNGNEAEVRSFFKNPNLNINAQNDRKNTAPMLAIQGGKQEVWGKNYQAIFNLLNAMPGIDWNLQNDQGQTALLNAIGWGRLDACKAILQKPDVNPNIASAQGSPLVAAIMCQFQELALALTNDPRVNVTQRGGDGKLPLQIVSETGLGLNSTLFNAIMRRTLKDYDIETKNIAQEIIGKLDPSTAGESITEVRNLLTNPEYNIDDYNAHEMGIIAGKTLQKIDHLLNIEDNDLLNNYLGRLVLLLDNIQLFCDFLINRDIASRDALFENLQ
jgi:hypothetical protein